MACPKCGGGERVEIAPGYYKCISTITDRSGGPGLTDPRLGPMVIESARVCGSEYQEGDSSTTNVMCWCRTFAVGQCVQCNRPVCGLHSTMAEKGRICQN